MGPPHRLQSLVFPPLLWHRPWLACYLVFLQDGLHLSLTILPRTTITILSLRDWETCCQTCPLSPPTHPLCSLYPFLTPPPQSMECRVAIQTLGIWLCPVSWILGIQTTRSTLLLRRDFETSCRTWLPSRLTLSLYHTRPLLTGFPTRETWCFQASWIPGIPCFNSRITATIITITTTMSTTRIVSRSSFLWSETAIKTRRIEVSHTYWRLKIRNIQLELPFKTFLVQKEPASHDHVFYSSFHSRPAMIEWQIEREILVWK